MGFVPVLVYHRVVGDGETKGSKFIVEATTFDRQLRYFSKRGYYTPALREMLDGEAGRRSTKRPFLITFDDGYLDTLEVAAPLLAKYGFSAIVFVIPNFSLRANSWDVAKGHEEARLMDAGQILALRAKGIEIGSHGWSHSSLPTLDDGELAAELERSKAAVEALLREPIVGFAYPYGEVDERVMDAARKAGYGCGFATNSGPMDFRSSLFRVRRTRIGNSSSRLYLFLKASGIEKAYRVARSSIRGAMR